MVKLSPSRGEKKKEREMRRNKRQSSRGAKRERKVIRGAKSKRGQEVQRQDGNEETKT
jgi:hypothetical protein